MIAKNNLTGNASATSVRRLSAGTPKVLLTGFEAFGGDTINPSWRVVSALDGQFIEGHVMLAAQLPCVFAQASQQLRRLLALHKPRLVICVGQAGGRSALSIERIAINVMDARIADNAGQQPIDQPVVIGGPAAYFSTLPIKAMLQAVVHAGVPAEISQTAGTFVCNQVFYALLHDLKKTRRLPGARGGFIHVPFLPGQGVPHMSLDHMMQGLQAAIGCALVNAEDAAIGAGSLS